MDLMSSAHVALRPLDEALLEDLAATAASDADPGEVMPPTEDGGGPGWTDARREAFVRFHRSRSLGPEPVETVYAVLVTEPGPDGRPREAVAGAARLAPAPEPDTVEAGLWLGRSHRGRGVGTAVLALLRDEARAAGATRLLARTDAAGAASRRLLATAGAGLETGGDGTVTARLPLTGRRRPA
ncbi:GNAT family N-acetyltransferase [Streptomyces fenghuangensis]|uniref:GNAT family N-acetyltransferase n=1 Tax=Streptomyces sp. ICN903 TaxID=2964654 RepID=UPI001ED9FA6A|nr:GNAT family N-acetyltransferase [Streptomyces sp. ICN903]MCG3040101.1 GNAT family N-acetyltransferase [Streptomyces sp. ICN903]